MPELPEVEVVRRGLERWVVGRTIAEAEVLHPRAIRRHIAGASDFAARLKGRQVRAARRRGKYLWLPLGSADALSGAPAAGDPEPAAPAHAPPPSEEPESGGPVLIAHLGMSGQLLMRPSDAPDETHLRIRVAFADDGPQLRFVDQRTFGGLAVEDAEGGGPPPSIAHIAPDVLDPAFDEAAFAAAVRRRDTGIKRALLDQGLVSGVGNIYADEALWRARLHYARPTQTLRRAEVRALVAAVREVMGEALAAGGTSFDSLYVNVNGQSGYFERSLQAYGREDLPCGRCGTPIRREAFMNRSSYFCPHCQRPRAPHAPRPAPSRG